MLERAAPAAGHRSAWITGAVLPGAPTPAMLMPRDVPLPAPPGLVQTLAAQITRHQADQRALPIQPTRDCPQLAADLVSGKDLEYRRLDGAFLTHCRLRRQGLCCVTIIGPAEVDPKRFCPWHIFRACGNRPLARCPNQ